MLKCRMCSYEGSNNKYSEHSMLLFSRYKCTSDTIVLPPSYDYKTAVYRDIICHTNSCFDNHASSMHKQIKISQNTCKISSREMSMFNMCHKFIYLNSS